MTEYAHVLSSPTQESLPPYSSAWSRDIDEKNEQSTDTKKKIWQWKWGTRAEWVDAYNAAPILFNDAILKRQKSTPRPGSPGLPPQKSRKAVILEQLYAFLLVAVFSVVPMSIYFAGTPIYSIFADKVLSCGNSFGTPENATVSGVEKLFVLDSTFGQFTFSQAKVLDVAWDIVVGRGVQLVCWGVGYLVFSDALLRAIERHPASFQIFQRIALEGPSLMSLWTLIKELWRAKSHRTKWLFFYIWLSTFYIISIPMLLGAMTGYDSTSIAWVSLDDSNNIVPAAALKTSYLVAGTWNQTWDENVCYDMDTLYSVNAAVYNRREHCNCQLQNGTIVNGSGYMRYQYGYTYNQQYMQNCKFNYPGQNGTFKYDSSSSGEPGKLGDTLSCAHSFNLTINNTAYDALDVNGTYGYCYNKKPYSYAFLDSRSRCLPDTANPSYTWGFSTSLSGLFVIFHAIWAVSMYILWQDAHFHSTLVRSGYQMTPLRAAFAMAKAAKRKTGLGEGQLVRANTKELEQELYGGKKMAGTSVEYSIFGDEDEECSVVCRRAREAEELSTISVETGERLERAERILLGPKRVRSLGLGGGAR